MNEPARGGSGGLVYTGIMSGVTQTSPHQDLNIRLEDGKMRKFITGLAAAAALAISALVATPQSASAQDFSITFGTGHPPAVRHYDPRPVRPFVPARPRFAPGPSRPHFGGPGRHYGRDLRHDRRGGRHVGRDCVVRSERYWDGFTWVSERRRICR
ncbi:MAG: hypothetical protein MEP57_03280 [Microvirga sp.]|nr:hypothetical protein [Microvirga sp.]